jgi:hypothetical protein
MTLLCRFGFQKTSVNFEKIIFKTYSHMVISYTVVWGRRGRDRKGIGFTTTCAISAYLH